MSGSDAARRDLYDPRFEHDSCGVGLVADLQGRASRELVRQGITGLVNLTHRGAVSADGLSGDGAGLMTQIPWALLQRELQTRRIALPPAGDLGVGVFFLPSGEAERDCVRLAEEALGRGGMTVLGWRDVPLDTEALGPAAAATLPTIRQVLVTRPADCPIDRFEQCLYLARRRTEQAVRRAGVGPLHIASFSSRTICYKGLMVGPQVATFYPDLADPAYISNFVIFHQRYSTNTMPTWDKAQPLHMLAHNGEINTLRGNVNRFKAAVTDLQCDVWGDDMADLLPLLDADISDSAALDAVLELLVLSGRDLLHAMMMLVPEAYQQNDEMPPEIRAFYEYHAALVAPWDGPAALTFSDGRFVGAALDRNGLRPLRYWLTRDDWLIVGSESGLTDVKLDDVVESNRLGPGQMIAVDTAHGVLLRNETVKWSRSTRQPFGRWLEERMLRPQLEPAADVSRRLVEELGDLLPIQQAFGYGREDLERVLHPMMYEGREPLGSMGDDTPLALLSSHPKSIYRYFKQIFAQVTNPPIDSLRERLVMSRRIALGGRANLLTETEEATSLIKFPTPILTTAQFDWLLRLDDERFRTGRVACRFPVDGGPDGMESALLDLCAQVAGLVRNGCSLIVLSDRNIDRENAPIPMLLATAAVHHYLIDAGLRMRASLICDTGDPRIDHHFACLLGYGAALIHPYLALATIAAEVDQPSRSEPIEIHSAVANYCTALHNGLLKIMAKLGISTINAYRGAQAFEALGISPDVVERFFPGTTSRVGGIELRHLATDYLRLHAEGFGTAEKMAHRGIFGHHKGGEYHATNPINTKLLHRAVRHRDADAYRRYTEAVEQRPPTHLRDLLTWQRADTPVPLAEVEPASALAKRFCTQAMSLGAISPEAHAVLAVAMNRLGGKSNSGEGGEDPRDHLADRQRDGNLRLPTWEPTPTDRAGSAIKQVASGRFGVTPAYLVAAREIEIKMAQGSKPGEGGHVTGPKVTEYIARLRRATPGAALISPPPHHDIYSIEDLGQLIYDLKRINPEAKIGVKLVSVSGVGTIAAGVVKAYADCIQVSGFDGGTGASPLSSIKHVGLPWELGLAEVQQVLIRNDLRGRVTVRVDGGLKTGRDVIIGALLGADEFGFGTTALVAAGCVMVRQCHLNTCPVGIATQREDLREKFPGTPDHVIALMLFIAEQVRHELAEIGVRRFEEIIGRVDLLRQRTDVQLARDVVVDLSALLADADPGRQRPRSCAQQHNPRPEAEEPLDERIRRDAAPAVTRGEPVVRSYTVSNVERSIGARLAGDIARATGEAGLPDSTVNLTLNGCAGQSFGAFNHHGMRLTLHGEAQDFVGKSMCGGTLIIRSPLSHDDVDAPSPVCMGNTVMYGATGGELYAAGRAGERFCVRNSGGWAVAEGCGDHGCEYMTRGVVAVLGETGRNFGAGMTGGVAYLLAPDGQRAPRINAMAVEARPLEDDLDRELLLRLLERFVTLTLSARGRRLLEDDAMLRARSRVIVPRVNNAAWQESMIQMKRAAIEQLADLQRMQSTG